MNVQDRYNSERYLDMTCFLALRNIERNERCLIEGKSQSAYAAEHGMARQSVHDAIALIRKKAKIYFA